MTVSDRLARFNRGVPNRVIGKIAGRRLSPVAYMVHQGRRSGRSASQSQPCSRYQVNVRLIPSRKVVCGA